MTNKVKILVACHKPAKVYHDDVYTPIQVGKALHPDLDLGFTTDDTGENISTENPYYCELTALYWGWKNLSCQYIGLQHYRRYLDTVFNEDNIDGFFHDCDIVMGKPVYLDVSIFGFWVGNLVPEDVYVALKLLEALYPEDYQTAKDYFANNIFYPCNIFVCRKDLLDEFATWEFKYLEILKNKLRLSGYSREKRILGFISEGLMPVYFLTRHYRMKTLDVVSYPHDGEVILHSTTKSKIKAILKKKIKKSTLLYSEDMLAGLRQDGILDSNNHMIL